MMKSQPQRATVQAGMVLLVGVSILIGCGEDSDPMAANGGDNAGSGSQMVDPMEQVMRTMMDDPMNEPTMNEPTMNEPTMGGSMGEPGLGQDATAGHPELEPTFTNIFENLLTNAATGNCMADACHGGDPTSMGNGNLQILSDDKEATYNNLVNADSTSDGCGELGMKRIAPGDPGASLLIVKLFEDPPCGMRMPIGPALQDTQVNQIATWIDMGAENN